MKHIGSYESLFDDSEIKEAISDIRNDVNNIKMKLNRCERASRPLMSTIIMFLKPLRWLCRSTRVGLDYMCGDHL